LAIKDIYASDGEIGNCITVEGGIYRIGDKLIPTHSSTLLMFLQTFLIGKNPEASNLYCAYSDGVVKTLFKGTLEVITDPITYGWSDIFPMHHIEGTDADQYLININRRKRYASLTCRSLYGTLNGACDCNGFLIGMIWSAASRKP
jgi:hypothetical protein